MATYAKAGYNAARYAAMRPTYPQQLFDFVFRYHERDSKARWETAVDIGCGTGIIDSRSCVFGAEEIIGHATVELKPFQRIIGVDPSKTMIEQAQKHIQASSSPGQLEFKQANAEDLSIFEDESVDLITSGWYERCPKSSHLIGRFDF